MNKIVALASLLILGLLALGCGKGGVEQKDVSEGQQNQIVEAPDNATPNAPIEPQREQSPEEKKQQPDAAAKSGPALLLSLESKDFGGDRLIFNKQFSFNRYATLSPDGLSLYERGVVWDVLTGKKKYALTLEKYQTPDYARFSSDGRFLMVAMACAASIKINHCSEICIYDAVTGAHKLSIPLPAKTRQPGSSSGVVSSSESKDGKYLAVLAMRSVRFFELATGREISQVPVPSGASNDHTRMQITPDGGAVLISDNGKVLRIDRDHGKVSEALSCEGTLVAFSEDTKLAVTALPSQFVEAGIKIWDIESKQPLKTIEFDKAPKGVYFTAAAFSPDNATVAVACKINATNYVLLVDPASGKRTVIDQRKGESVRAGRISFMENNTLLAIYYGSTLSVWDLSTSQCHLAKAARKIQEEKNAIAMAEKERKEQSGKRKEAEQQAALARVKEELAAFAAKEKARLDDKYGFSKLDYSKGPNGEKLEERQEKQQSFQGFVNTKGEFVRHGRLVIWAVRPSQADPEGKKLGEAWVYNGKEHGVAFAWGNNGLLRQLFVERDNVFDGPLLQWDEKGVLRHEQQFTSGKIHGEAIWYSADGKKTFRFENGKLLFNRRDKTKSAFMDLLKYAATTYSDPRPGVFIGRYNRETFFAWVGEPDRKKGEGLSDTFPERLWTGRYWYTCSDGVLSFKVSIAPPQNLVTLEMDD